MRRNFFNLSYYKLLTMNMGKLVPIGLKEIIPGDKFRMTTTAPIVTGKQNCVSFHLL